jgi:hypothetical protein
VALLQIAINTQFIGLTQHDLYHAGQIALLKRALAAIETAPESKAADTGPPIG